MKKIIIFTFFSLVLSACTSTHLREGGSWGGVVKDHFSDRSYSKVVRLAEEHCRAFNKSHEMVDKENASFLKSEYDTYRFRCVAAPKSSYEVSAPTPRSTSDSLQNSAPAKVSLDDATQKCTSLGFQPGTESFGNCVLKISR
jgi:hypothetical protein